MNKVFTLNNYTLIVFKSCGNSFICSAQIRCLNFVAISRSFKKYNAIYFIVYNSTYHILICYKFIAVSRLMGSSAGGSMGHAMSNMGSLAACSVSADSKPMQFPLAQRRKRRVLFTQAQVSHVFLFNYYYIVHKKCFRTHSNATYGSHSNKTKYRTY